MSNWTVICATIAAGFSAITAFLAYRVQKKVAYQSIRPLITLYDWQTGVTNIQKKLGIIEVKTIKNYGSGPALKISACVKSIRELLYVPRMVTNIVQAVQPQEERSINWQFFLANALDKSLSPQEFTKIKIEHINFQILLRYADIHNKMYYTIFDLLFVREPGCLISVYEKLTPELVLLRQKTVVRSSWFIHFMSYMHVILNKLHLKLLARWPFLCIQKREKSKKAQVKK